MEVSNPFRQRLRDIPETELTLCRLCLRLVEWREAQSQRVPPRFREWVTAHGFWGRPVPAFGDPAAWLAVVGLAPAAQGGNRTGRVFTGDRSGDFLYAALHLAGLANQAESTHRGDGLELAGVLVTAAARCAPPANRLLGEELARCRPYLRADLADLGALRVVLALGGVAHGALVALLAEQGMAPRPKPRFAHAAEHRLPGGVWLVDSYHVSQQNTFTGRLTPQMLDGVLARCRRLRDDAGLAERARTV
jgi:uracil-DNA glycosylase family 4